MHYERYSSIFYCGTLITPYESGQSSRHCYHKDLQKKYYKCFHSTIKHKLRIKVTGYHFIFLTPFLYLMTQICLLLYLILVSFYRPLFFLSTAQRIVTSYLTNLLCHCLLYIDAFGSQDIISWFSPPCIACDNYMSLFTFFAH